MTAWRGTPIGRTEPSKELLLLTITTIMLFLSTQTVQPILSLYITEKGATNFELGIIISLLSFVAIVAKIPLGILAESIGRWSIIPAVAVGQTISLLLYSIVPNPSWFYPIRIFHALILAAYAPTAIAITQDLSPEDKRGTTMGVFLTSVGVTTMMGPFLCMFFINYFAYEQLFQIASIIPLLGLLPFAFIIRDKNSYKANHRKKKNLNFKDSLRKIVYSRSILVLTYLRLAFSFANAFFITFFAIYAEESLFISSSLIAMLFGIKGVSNMLSRIPSGKLTDSVGHKYPIIIAFTLLAVSFFIMSETNNIYLLAFVLIIYGAAHGMRAVAEWSSLGDYAPLQAGNVATAYLSTMFNVGAAFGALVAGALSIAVDISSMFKLASIIVFSGVIMVMLQQRKLKRSIST